MVASTKVWWGKDSGNEGDYSEPANWVPTSLVRSGVLKWTASGSGTDEYYAELNAGGDPGFLEPATLYENGVALAAGAAGALTAGQWDFGDNDTLGFNTIYVRTTGGADPDSLGAGAIAGTLIPVATDLVEIPPGSNAISSGLDQSAVALASFRVLRGYREAIGVNTGAEPSYLRVDPDAFYFEGEGTSFIDLGAAAIAANVLNAGRGLGPGTAGVYLKGSNLSAVNVENGVAGLAMRPGETSTAAVARVGTSQNAILTCGSGVTLTDAACNGGTLVVQCAVSGDIDQYGGNVVKEGGGTVAEWIQDGGTSYPNNGTVTVMTANAGTVDLTRSSIPRTIGTLNEGSRSTIKRDPSVVTVTTHNKPTTPYSSANTPV
jgi:hypothetical protein